MATLSSLAVKKSYTDWFFSGLNKLRFSSFTRLYIAKHANNKRMSNYVIVDITEGSLRGQKKVSVLGKQYCAFQGIRYAKPPLGHLRFKGPEPPERWSGVRDALGDGDVCPQKDLMMALGAEGECIGDEDCLFLNLYTNQLNEDPKRAVMVWIHGGGFTMGSGGSKTRGPDFLIQHDIVLVTFNYRVGALGFLSTGDDVASGNWGLKDQVAALRWVQRNIGYFGGDPDNVTIFGNSAGAASIQCHMISHMSKGLFKRSIMQSGSCLNPWALVTAPTNRERALALGAAFDIVTTDSHLLVDKLRQIPVIDLVKNQFSVISKEDRQQGLVFPFVPCIEVGANESDMFLTDHPVELLANPIPYPCIIGVNSNEGLILLKALPHTADVLATINNHFGRCIPRSVSLGRSSDELAVIEQQVRRLYWGDEALTLDTLDKYLQLQGDNLFNTGIQYAVNLFLKHSTAPLYLYKFSFEGSNGHLKNLIKTNIPGVCHADEVGYLFHNSVPGPFMLTPEMQELKIIHQMTGMWTQFSKTGNPNIHGIGTKWNPTQTEAAAHLDIGPEMRLKKTTFFPERDEFWKRLSKNPIAGDLFQITDSVSHVE